MTTEAPDNWKKADIVLRAVSGLLTALAVASLGLFGTCYLERQQESANSTRLYAELMSSREKADSDLRKDMFNSILTTFLKDDEAVGQPGQLTEQDLEQRVLNLELLAYNFDQALDLGPLFKHLQRYLRTAPEEHSPALLSRLETSAREVKQRQVESLYAAGAKTDKSVDLEKLKTEPAGIKVIDEEPLKFHIPGHSELKVRKAVFSLEVLAVRDQEVRVQLRVISEGKREGEFETTRALFWLGFFDFPMIDNTRLPGGDRCAVVLERLEEFSAELTVVYFPGTRASLKDKPYYDEILHDLLETQEAHE